VFDGKLIVVESAKVTFSRPISGEAVAAV